MSEQPEKPITTSLVDLVNPLVAKPARRNAEENFYYASQWGATCWRFSKHRLARNFVGPSSDPV